MPLRVSFEQATQEGLRSLQLFPFRSVIQDGKFFKIVKKMLENDPKGDPKWVNWVCTRRSINIWNTSYNFESANVTERQNFKKFSAYCDTSSYKFKWWVPRNLGRLCLRLKSTVKPCKVWQWNTFAFFIDQANKNKDIHFRGKHPVFVSLTIQSRLSENIDTGEKQDKCNSVECYTSHDRERREKGTDSAAEAANLLEHGA